MMSPGVETFGIRMASGPAWAAAIKSSLPQGVVGPLTRMTTSRRPKPPALTAAGDLLARNFLGVRRDGVFEIEDQRVGGEGLGFFQRAGVRAGHVEDAAAGAKAGHVVSVEYFTARHHNVSVGVTPLSF